MCIKHTNEPKILNLVLTVVGGWYMNEGNHQPEVIAIFYYSVLFGALNLNPDVIDVNFIWQTHNRLQANTKSLIETLYQGYKFLYTQ